MKNSAPGGAPSRPDHRTARSVQHRSEVVEGILSHARRLRWSPERVDAERQRALRALLRFAKERSPFHSERLVAVEPSQFTENQLSSLPTMTKREMTEALPEVVTDSRLTREAIDAHLESVDHGGGDYLFDRYRVIESSGSSGLRGTYVYDWDGWTTLALMASRSRMDMLDGSPRVPGSATMSLLGLGMGTLSSAMGAFLADPGDPPHHLPMTLPVPDLLAALDASRPALVQAYPTCLDVLVHETRAGRLHIAPHYVESGGELLSPRTRNAVREVWGTEIDDCWGLSEGIFGYSCRARPDALHLPDDLVIVEPVDLDGRVLEAGRPATKVYITNLYNYAQPLIRFEVPDGLTVREGTCDCGSSYRRIEALTGRNDQVFDFAEGVVVYPMVLGLELEKEQGLVEYQLHQTQRGVTVRAVVEPIVVPEDLGQCVVRVLEAAGLVRPQVSVEVVHHIERLASGKLRQFVALPNGAKER